VGFVRGILALALLTAKAFAAIFAAIFAASLELSFAIRSFSFKRLLIRFILIFINSSKLILFSLSPTLISLAAFSSFGSFAFSSFGAIIIISSYFFWFICKC
jgi:hypothetical protein